MSTPDPYITAWPAPTRQSRKHCPSCGHLAVHTDCATDCPTCELAAPEGDTDG